MTELTVTTPTWTETSISAASITEHAGYTSNMTELGAYSISFTERFPTPEGKSTYWESTLTTWESGDTPVIWIGMDEASSYSEAN
jgi:hypothetical protein|tara:strand:- start:964 stop:1218 length:255 start_codon:yes stop_codon:yes gene_type:complete